MWLWPRWREEWGGERQCQVKWGCGRVMVSGGRCHSNEFHRETAGIPLGLEVGTRRGLQVASAVEGGDDRPHPCGSREAAPVGKVICGGRERRRLLLCQLKSLLGGGCLR